MSPSFVRVNRPLKFRRSNGSDTIGVNEAQAVSFPEFDFAPRLQARGRKGLKLRHAPALVMVSPQVTRCEGQVRVARRR